jgi:hypothetical protein
VGLSCGSFFVITGVRRAWVRRAWVRRVGVRRVWVRRVWVRQGFTIVILVTSSFRAFPLSLYVSLLAYMQRGGPEPVFSYHISTTHASDVPFAQSSFTHYEF